MDEELTNRPNAAATLARHRDHRPANIPWRDQSAAKGSIERRFHGARTTHCSEVDERPSDRRARDLVSRHHPLRVQIHEPMHDDTMQLRRAGAARGDLDRRVLEGEKTVKHGGRAMRCHGFDTDREARREQIPLVGRWHAGDDVHRFVHPLPATGAFAALHRAGFANRAESVSVDDGLRLDGAYVAAAVRCAPPQNKPTPGERDECLPYLVREIELLPSVRVVVALGSFGYQALWSALAHTCVLPRPRPRFAHGAEVELDRLTVLCSYHPSQQNTFTGKLTREMFDAVFSRAAALTGR